MRKYLLNYASENIEKWLQIRKNSYLQPLGRYGPEGSRTPVRKPIPRSSTIIVRRYLFACQTGGEHPVSQAKLHDTPIYSKLCISRFLSDRCPQLAGTGTRERTQAALRLQELIYYR